MPDKQTILMKKVFLLIFASLIISTAIFAQSSNGGLKDQAALVSEFEVNGLKILIKRRPNVETVSAGLFVRGGARNITAANAGIENLMLEAATEGSQKYPRETLRRALAATGGSISGGAGKDFSAFSLASTRPNFDKTWEIFTDLVLHPTFEKDDVERARARLLTGLRESETDNDNFLQILQSRYIYAKHPYANDVGGTLETVGKFTAADLRDYHGQILETSRLLLVVVGDIDAADLRKKVEASFGKLPRGKYTEKPFPALDFSKATLDIATRDIPTNYVEGVFAAPNLDNPDYYPMRVAVAILQSAVFQEVRVNRQLSYAPNAELASDAANSANIYVTAVDANKAVSVMLEQIKLLQNNQIRPEAIEEISSNFLTIYYLDQQTNAAQARELAKYELIGGGWRNLFDVLDKVRQVTPEQVREVSRKYMKNIRFVVVGDPKAIDRKIFLPNG